MYTLFSGLMKKPLVLIGLAIVVFMTVMTVSSGLSSIGTALGFNTKENLLIKVEKTTNELEKAVAVIENNTTEQKVKEEISTITEAKKEADAIVVNNIKDEEVRVLEQIKNTANYTEPVVEESNQCTDVSKPPSKQLVTVRSVSKPRVLTNKHKVGLSILRDRANKLKGARV